MSMVGTGGEGGHGAEGGGGKAGGGGGGGPRGGGGINGAGGGGMPGKVQVFNFNIAVRVSKQNYLQL